ncbi:MAG: arylsulfatase [Bacteroidetes bacterium]|jgi:arylsulfatase A-like enzyme|nr:arylsulfatase [Bacteroidota bacterium]
MNRIKIICFSFFFLLVIISCQEQKTIITIKPNIVIILADDQGWGDLSLNGNPLVSSPNIDKLATQGVVLDNFYVNPVCSPTRAELLTGRYHVRGGVYSTSEGGERLDLEENTIAEAFQTAGYKTGAFGKWHNGMQPPYHPNARGFDEFYGYCSGHWGSYVDAVLENNGKIIQTKGYLTDVLTNSAIDFISENSENPFLAYLPLNTPHSPMQVPDKWFDKFKDVTLPKHRYSEKEDIEKTKAAYAMAENIDWNVGRVMHALDSLGISENTIIIYFSDNGPNGSRWNSNMKGQKGDTDEGGVRSPFVIKWGDKISGGKKIETIAHAIDLYPTLTALTEVPPKNKLPFDGTNLATLLLDKKEKTEERILYSYWRENLSLRNQQFRLDKDNQLFDMQKDLAQEQDVSDDFPEIYQQLIAAKSKWEKEVLSELPKVDERSFPITHPDFSITQLPARDAKVDGEIIRSNRWPNCSFYTNWKNEKDKIYWKGEVLAAGEYQPVIYYTCAKENIGVTINLFDTNKLLTRSKIEKAFNPPLRGMEYDRIEREESYVKDWNQLILNPISLSEGSIELRLTASDIQGGQAIDFRLMTLERVN